MTQVTLKGNPFRIAGPLPGVGAEAPPFALVGRDLGEVARDSFPGKRVVLNIFPSVDTPVCAASVRRFNVLASGLPDTVVVCASADLPFATQRFCGAEGLEYVVTASTFRSPDFGKAYGVELMEGPLKGLMARAVVAMGADGKVIHTQLVPEIGQEPDYDAVMDALRQAQ